MLHGGIIGKGWQSEEVHEALDLCLACKGCKRDCPVNVDMATYKAEFNAHYYKRRLRPRSAYSMGLIYWWSRLASHAPGLVNGLLKTPGLSRLIKAAGGIHPEAELPALRQANLPELDEGPPAEGRQPRQRSSCSRTPSPTSSGRARRVAAVEVLEHLGYEVRIPKRILCCGRPLYDEGMLTTARHLLRQIMRTLGPEVSEQTPLVGLEPACVAAFRDELINMFPKDERAQRIAKNTYILSEFLAKQGVPLPELPAKAKVHVHCNHHAVLDPQRRADDPQGDEARFRAAGFRLLRHGGLVRLRGGALRRLDEVRRAGAPAGGARGGQVDADHLRRLQLPRADRPGDRPPGAAPRPGHPYGAARAGTG